MRDILYIKDLIEAFDAFLNSNLKHQAFNIGEGPENTLSLLELLKLLEKLTGKRPKVSFSSQIPADQKVYISDISKATKLLGWKPQVKPEKGVRKVAEWISENLRLFT